MNLKTLFLASFIILFLAQPSFAEIFKWVDEKGVAHFTDDPAQIPKGKNRSKPRRKKPTPQYETSLSNLWDVFEEEKRSSKIEDGIREESIKE